MFVPGKGTEFFLLKAWFHQQVLILNLAQIWRLWRTALRLLVSQLGFSLIGQLAHSQGNPSLVTISTVQALSYPHFIVTHYNNLHAFSLLSAE